MDKKRRMSPERWVILGLLVVMISMLGGFAIASGSPSSITTCTKASNNKTKIITTSGVGKCIAKGKGTADTWDNHSVVQSQLAAKDAQFNTIKSQECNFIDGLGADPITFNEITNQPSLLSEATTLSNYC